MDLLAYFTKLLVITINNTILSHKYYACPPGCSGELLGSDEVAKALAAREAVLGQQYCCLGPLCIAPVMQDLV